MSAADTPWGRVLLARQTLGFEHPIADDLLAASRDMRNVEDQLESVRHHLEDERRKHRAEIDRLTATRRVGLDELQAFIARLVGIDAEELPEIDQIDIHMQPGAIRVATYRHATTAQIDATDEHTAAMAWQAFELVPTEPGVST